MPSSSIYENIATMAVAGGTILGLYAMGAGEFSAIGLAFLLNLNSPVKRKPQS